MSEQDENLNQDEQGEKGQDDQLAAVNERIGKAFEAIEGISRQLGTLSGSVSQFVEGARKQAEPKEEEEDTPPQDLSDEELEALSHKDRVRYYKELAKYEVRKELKGVTKRLETDETTRAKERYQQEVNNLAEKNKDFWEWKEDIRAQIENNPALTITQAFKLARADNPDKVEVMKKKYADKKATEDEGEDEKGGTGKAKPPFGGLKPSSGRKAPVSTKNVDTKSAMLAAWDKTMAGVSKDLFES